MSNLVLFAGASNGKKVVSFYHGDHLNCAPPIISRWTEIAGLCLANSPIGQWIMNGEKISNYKDQWVFVVVKEI
jgi:hypothetical protein